MNADLTEILYTQDAIQARVAEMAAQISADFRDKNPIVVCLLKGAFLFFSDLTRRMDLFMEMDFLSCSSYGGGRRRAGSSRIAGTWRSRSKDAT
jgi:hypoxanthine phosphoribosyltransferase